MELVARCSNQRDRLTAVCRAASPTVRTAQAEVARPRVHRLEDRLGPAVVEELLAAYRGGEPANAIAARFGISRNSVNLLAADAGLPRRNKRLTPDERERAVALYGAGLSLAEVGRWLGCSAGTVRNLVVEAGAARRVDRGS